MSSTTIDNTMSSIQHRSATSCLMAINFKKSTMKMVKNGPLLTLILKELKRLYHTWGKEMSERGGWASSGITMTNLVLWIALWISEL